MDLRNGRRITKPKRCQTLTEGGSQGRSIRRRKEDAHEYDQTQVVHFRSLEKPKEDGFCLELSMILTYDDVTERVARHLGLDDSTKIRLTSHNCHSQLPKPQPVKYQGVDHLSDMLVHYNETSDILYYEVLDIPLPELQDLKTLEVAFHHATKDEVLVHSIRLPKQSTVSDVINDLKIKVELSHPNAELRLFKIFSHMIIKVFPLSERIENINHQFWTLHAEEIPEEEKNLGPHDRLTHVHHFTKDASQTKMARNFGQPFFLIIHEGETFAAIKVRIQKKLQVPYDEFSKWKFARWSLGRNYYLQDSDIVSNHFLYLGLEHSVSASESGYGANQSNAVSLKSAKTVPRAGMPVEVVAPVPVVDQVTLLLPKSEGYIELDGQINEPMLVVETSTEVQLAKQVSEPMTMVSAILTQDEVEVTASTAQSVDLIPLPKYPGAGQLFEEGRHCQSFPDEKYEDIGGFSVLKTHASLYKQIWLKYGHIASSQVLTTSYFGQVWVVTDIMNSVMEMHHCRLAEVSSKLIDLWEEKIKMGEKLEFNIRWLRERFEDVKKDFFGEQKLKTALLEEDQSILDAKARLVMAKAQFILAEDELKKAQENMSSLETRVSPLLSERQIYQEKGCRYLFDGLL